MKNWLFGICCTIVFTYTACTYNQLSVIENCENDLALNVAELVASACGVASGEITVTVAGAVAGVPISYSLNGGPGQEATTFSGLPAGNYEITVVQGLCESMLEVVLENSEGLRVTSQTIPSECGTSSGSITLNAFDAAGQVTFSLDGGQPQTEPVFTGLEPGSYALIAVDEIGCTVSLEVTVASNVDFENIQALVTSSCALSGCHAGNVSPDFRVSDNIVSQATRIGARTSSRSMPPPSSGGSLSQSQIDAINCWITDGAPD